VDFIQKLFTSRTNGADSSTYIGEENRIWWDPIRNGFYRGDGHTPGGILIGTGVGGLSGYSGFSGAAGVGSAPAGSNTNVQFNNAGTLGASNAFTFNTSANVVTVAGTIDSRNINVSADPLSNQGALKLAGNASPTVLNVGVMQINEPLSYTDLNILSSATASVDNYAEVVIQNKSPGPAAQTDFIVTNDQGSINNYGDFGINSSNFSGPGPFGTPGGTYLYSANNSITIGTLNNNDVIIATNNVPRFTITKDGFANVGPLANLTITGGLDGQIIQTDGQGNLTWATNITDPVGLAGSLYLDPIHSISDSRFLSTTPSINPETTFSGTAVASAYSGVGYLKRFISGAVGTTTLGAGIWTFTNYVSVDNNADSNKVITRINHRKTYEGITGTFTGTGPDRTFTVTGGTPFVPGDVGDGTMLTATLLETPTQTGWVIGFTAADVVTIHLSDPGFVNTVNTPMTALYYWLFDTKAQATSLLYSGAIETQNISLYQPEFTGFSPADRLVAAYFGVTDSLIPHTFTLYTAGSVNYSKIATPFSTTNQFQQDIHRSGFLNQTETVMSFDPITYTFTLGDVGAGWTYYREGFRLTMYGNRTVTLPGAPPTEGLWFIYIGDNLGNLTASLVPWTLLDSNIPVVAIPFCVDSTPKYFLEEERHTVLIDRRIHYYLHTTRGTQYVSGGNISGYAVGVDTDVAHTVALTETVIA
jgi:hypothetical protein